MVYGQILHRSGTEEELINLNVGGFKKKVKQSTLLRFPQTRLGKLLNCESEEAILRLCDDYNVTDKEYYFDRNPCMFRYVLNFYYTGKLHLMEELCVFSFSQEIDYWGITELSLGSCCSSIYQELKEDGIDIDWEQTSDEQQTFDSSFEELSVLDTELEKFEGLCCADIRRGIWVRLENPGYSISAKLIAIASLSVVLISIVAMCIHSMPEFQKFDASDKEIEDPALAVLEIVCIIFFSIEFMVRLIVAPCRRKFFGNPLNTIDFVSIIPFYATLAIDTVDEESENLENVGKVVQILRLMRIFRILKLARHSVGLRSLGATLRHSYHEMADFHLTLGTICLAIQSRALCSLYTAPAHMAAISHLPIKPQSFPKKLIIIFLSWVEGWLVLHSSKTIKGPSRNGWAGWSAVDEALATEFPAVKLLLMETTNLCAMTSRHSRAPLCRYSGASPFGAGDSRASPSGAGDSGASPSEAGIANSPPLAVEVGVTGSLPLSLKTGAALPQSLETTSGVSLLALKTAEASLPQALETAALVPPPQTMETAVAPPLLSPGSAARLTWGDSNSFLDMWDGNISISGTWGGNT
ncbi:KCNS3 protein, partial [Polyodon spathula]|nr:KCNS3 protein [Polyodon spathula]